MDLAFQTVLDEPDLSIVNEINTEQRLNYCADVVQLKLLACHDHIIKTAVALSFIVKRVNSEDDRKVKMKLRRVLKATSDKANFVDNIKNFNRYWDAFRRHGHENEHGQRTRQMKKKMKRQ